MNPVSCIILKLSWMYSYNPDVLYLISTYALQSSKAQSSPFGIGSGHSYQTDPASYSPLSSPATSSPSGNAYSGLTNRSTAFGEPSSSSFILIYYWVSCCNIPPVWWRTFTCCGSLSVSVFLSANVILSTVTEEQCAIETYLQHRVCSVEALLR